MKFEIGKTYTFRNLRTEESNSFQKGDDYVYETLVWSGGTWTLTFEDEYEIEMLMDGQIKNDPPTFEFDDDQTLTGGGTANLVATQGNQLDDLSIGGTYTGYEAKNYIIEIDGIGTPNTFRWSKDGGVTFVNENVSITGAAQTLENGLSISIVYGDI